MTPSSSVPATDWSAVDWRSLSRGFLAFVSRPSEIPIVFGLPPIRSVEDVTEASSALIASVSDGEITAREAMPAMRLLAAHMRLLAAAARTQRMAAR